MSAVLDQLRELIREELRTGLTVAYEHGFNAGTKSASLDGEAYRRDYMAGYGAGRRGSGNGQPIKGPRQRVSA